MERQCIDPDVWLNVGRFGTSIDMSTLMPAFQSEKTGSTPVGSANALILLIFVF
jgi:hypothetical protein